MCWSYSLSNEETDGKTIGGRGRLTDKRIDSLQVYYGKAIRNTTNSIATLQNAALAIWTHYRSTDADPKHEACLAHYLKGYPATLRKTDVRQKWTLIV